MKLLSSIHIIDVGSKLKVVMVWWGVGESNLQKCFCGHFECMYYVYVCKKLPCSPRSNVYVCTV